MPLVSFFQVSKVVRISFGLCSRCGQKRLRWAPQHAAEVDFAAGGRKSSRFNQESLTWAREQWSNEMRATTSLTPDIPFKRTSQERAWVLHKYCSICQRDNDNILKDWQEKDGHWVIFFIKIALKIPFMF